MKDSIV
jgi:hypothetical protein